MLTAPAPTTPEYRSALTSAGGRAHLQVGLASLLALLGGLAGLATSDDTQIGSLGLLPALPVVYFVALAVVVVDLFVLVHRAAPGWLLALHVVGLILLLDGAPALLESEPRSTVAWLHAGFVDQIVTNGEVLEDYDARMSWPGFFAAVAVLVGAADLPDALGLLRWAPAVLHLLYLGPLLLIGRSLVADRRARWTAIALFYAGDWVGQAYFSPQGIAYVLLLSMVALLVAFFPHTLRPDTGLRARWYRLLDRVSAPPVAVRALPVKAQVGVFLLLVLLTIGLVPSHQLTPAALLFDLAALVVLGRLGLSTYPVLLLLCFVGYVAFGATDYWLGHRADLIGNGGQTAVAANLGERLRGSDEHLLVVRVRLAVTAAVFLAALAGVVLALRRRRLVLPLVALAGASLPLPLVQAYGGEALLRVVFYSLPFAALLAASAFFTGSRVRRRQSAVAAAFVLLLVAVFPVARYGNESFESVRPGEAAALERFYAAAPAGSTIAALIDNVPWRTRELRGYRYLVVDSAVDKTDPFQVVRALDDVAGRLYVVLSRGQEAWGTENYGYPDSWLRDIAQALRDDPAYQQIGNDPDALVFARRFVGPGALTATQQAELERRINTPVGQR